MLHITPYLSQFNDYCEGYFPDKTDMQAYLVGINYASAVVPLSFSHEGSDNLDRIQAFDLAEVSDVHLGQVNMITVSSFCGPNGKIWGLDVAKKKDIPITHLDACKTIDIFDITPLKEAFKNLTGTVTNPHYPFFPGSHVLCATKNITHTGPCTLYSGIAMGLPKNRYKNAILFMEDVGKICPSKSIDELKNNLCNSVLGIAKKQHIVYERIFVGISSTEVKEGEMGCALVASPYFLLAKQAQSLL